ILFLSSQFAFRPGIIEKDYYITIILNNINSMLSKKIVFKGGTLLNKIYFNYKRLSEDIDFTFIPNVHLNSRGARSRNMKQIKTKMPDFLKKLNLRSPNTNGEGFNNSQQYVFYINYPSVITEKYESIKLEISLRQFPIDKIVQNTVKHFYKDPFTGGDLVPSNKITCLSIKEAVAEKMKAAVTRREPAIRDFYDLWYISESYFDFKDPDFIKIFRKKLEDESFTGNFKYNLGLNKKSLENLNKQIESMLTPVIKINEKFEITKVLNRYNKILKYF
ncbi:MAG: nucleotidyl transferase AbiEii/AbiGii toxin family protein, partial [Actinomycetota bacterium]